MTLDQQERIFQIFHDGSLIHIEKIGNDIHINIEILYLAEMIKPSHSLFKVKLINCDFFKLEDDKYKKTYTDPAAISELEPDILYSYIENMDHIRISCNMDVNDSFGNLYFKAESIEVFDEEDNPVTYDELCELSRKYWEK